MLKYVGTYRVNLQQTQAGEFSTNEDDLYIECNNDIQIFRYDKKTLALYVPTTYFSKKLAKDLYDYLTQKSKDHIDHDEIEGENIFYFEEKNMNKIVEYVKPKTKGKDIKPNSVKNLKSYTPYEIKNEKLSKEFSEKIKILVDSCGGSPRYYIKIYEFMVDQLIKRNKPNFLKYAEEQELRPIQAIDALNLYDDCIRLLYDYDIIYKL